MKADDYNNLRFAYNSATEDIAKHEKHIEKLEKEFDTRIKKLIDKHKVDLNKYINAKHELEDRVSNLEEQINLQKINIKSLKKSNAGYKSNNTRLKNEKKALQKELDNSFKRIELPPDRTKSKQVPKIKSSRRESGLAKMMNR